MTHKCRAIATKQANSTGRGILGENPEPKTSVLECDSYADANGCWTVLRSSDKLLSLRNNERESVIRQSILHTTIHRPASCISYKSREDSGRGQMTDSYYPTSCARTNGLKVEDIPLCYCRGNSLNRIHDPETGERRGSHSLSASMAAPHLPRNAPSEFECTSCDEIWLMYI
jgi:hypothetical protein